MGEETGQGLLQDPETIRQAFMAGQVLLGALVLFVVFRIFGGSGESAFRSREADKPRKSSATAPHRIAGPDPLAEAKIQKRKPLQLEGIRVDGAPHEILGVASDAAPAQIQKAYRELMKRYHPDRVGRPGSREWTDAQKIAEAINAAKEALLARHKKG